MQKSKMLGLSLLVMMLWGSLFPVVQLGYGAYSVVSVADILFFAGVRFSISGGIICLFQLFKNRASFQAVWKALPAVLASGLFAVILHYAFTYIGLTMTESSKVSLLKQAGVLFYVCFSFLFFKNDRLTLKKLLGAVLGFSGIIAMNFGSAGISFGWGELMILAASFCTVFSNVIGKKALQQNTDPITVTGVSHFAGGLVLLILGFCFGGRMQFAWNGDSWIMIYICLASIFSYCIWFTVVKSGELSRLFIIKFAEPVFAAVFSAILVSENIFTLQHLAAFLLIGAGVWVSNQK